MPTDTLTALKEIAATNQWSALAPEITLGVFALLLLALELALPKRAVAVAVQRVAFLGLAVSLVWVLKDWAAPALHLTLFGGLVRQTTDSQIMRVFFLVASALVAFIATVVLPKHRAPRVEFFHVLLVATGALMLLPQSNHFVQLFVALETVTVAFYILVAYFRTSPFSLEAGLKYLVMGSLSSALLLFGIVLLYGVAGNPQLAGHTVQAMNFGELAAFVRLNPDHPLVLVGAALVLCGIAFKIGAVPFQIWVPDVYQGAPTPVTAFLAVSSKAAGFALLLILVRGPFQALAHVTIPLLSTFAALSLLFGNLAALGQRNVKRLMGLSGVSHAGFLLVGVVAAIAREDAVSWAPAAVYFYLFTYLIGAMAAFGVMAHVSVGDDADQDFRHFAGLARRSPLLGAVLACGVGSLVGIPPLAGFIGKLLIFVAAFQAHQWTLLGVAIVAVVISIYYYFGWVRAAFYEDVPASERNVAPLHLGVAAGLTLAALALAAVLLGLYQGPLGQWIASR